MNGITGRVNRDLRNPLEHLVNQSGVKKITLGDFENTRHSKGHGTIKYICDTVSGIKIKAFSGDGIQVGFVVCEEGYRDSLRDYIQKTYG